MSTTENMVKGLEEDETSFLDEVSRQQCLIEKRRREEDAQEIKEYRISFLKRTQFYFHPTLEKLTGSFALRPKLSPLSHSLRRQWKTQLSNTLMPVKSKVEFLYFVSVHALK